MADQLKYTNKLQGARVLLLGGSSGIGFGVAEAVLEHGASDIVISSSQQSRIDSAISRLKTAYPSLSSKATIRGYACDLSDMDTMDAAVTALLKAATNNGTAPIDHAVFSAGNSHKFVPVPELTPRIQAERGTVRFFAQFNFVKQLLLGGFIKKSPDSSITMTGGTVGEKPEPGWTGNAGFAAGQQGNMRALALDYAPVRVNLVSPGAIETELWAGFGVRGDAMKEKILKHLPVGRIGRPEDVAEAYLYCMRDGFVTGSLISSNGGYLLLGPQVFQ